MRFLNVKLRSSLDLIYIYIYIYIYIKVYKCTQRWYGQSVCMKTMHNYKNEHCNREKNYLKLNRNKSDCHVRLIQIGYKNTNKAKHIDIMQKREQEIKYTIATK